MPASRLRMVVAVLNVAVLLGGVVGFATISDERSGVAVRSRDGAVEDEREGDDSQAATGSDSTSGDAVAERPDAGGAQNPQGTSGTTTPAARKSNDEGGVRVTPDGVYESRVVTDYSGLPGDGGDDDPSSDELGRESENNIERVRVTTSSRVGDEVRQVHSETQVDEEDAGEYSEDEDDGIEQQIRWTREGVFIAFDSEESCEPNELRLLKLPLSRGSTWADHLECRGEGEPGEPRMSASIDVKSKVLGSKQVRALGRTMLVWEIEMEVTSKIEFSGETTTSTAVRRSQFAPEIGYDVHAEEEHRGSEGSTRGFAYRSTTDLLQFTPA